MSRAPLKPFTLSAGIAALLSLLSQPAIGQQAFTAVIEFDEYAFPQADTDGGIVVQGPGGSTTESYNLLDDVTGDELGADNEDLADFVFTYTASLPADLTPADRPDLRFRESGAAGDQITGRTSYSLGAPSANNPGSRHFYEVEVRFAEHVDVTELLLDFSSLNTSGIAWEFSSISFLDQDGNPFSPVPFIPPYLDYEPGQTGNVAPGHYLLALTGTVEGVGGDQTSSGTSNPPSDGPILLSEADLGVAGQVIGGLIWRTTLEDVRGVGNGSTNFTSSLREMTLSGTLVQQPEGADLSITQDTVVHEDGTVDFEIEVANDGPENATGVEVTDMLPECAVYAADDCGGQEGPPFTWTIGALANEASASCTMTAEASSCEGEQTAVAEVTADQDDPDPDDNTAEAVFDIEVVPALPWLATVLLILLLWVIATRSLRRSRA